MTSQVNKNGTAQRILWWILGTMVLVAGAAWGITWQVTSLAFARHEAAIEKNTERSLANKTLIPEIREDIAEVKVMLRALTIERLGYIPK